MPLPDVLANAADALFWREEVARAYQPAKLPTYPPLRQSFGIDRGEAVHRYQVLVQRVRSTGAEGLAWVPDPAERWLGDLPAMPDDPDPDLRWRLGPWATYDVARFVTEADRRARALRSPQGRKAGAQRATSKQIADLQAYIDEGNAGIAASSRIWLPYLAVGTTPAAPSKIGVW